MNSDIVDLRSFYSTPLGRLAEHSITMALSSVWARLPNERLVGLGYTLPWLDRFGADAERVFAFMPATQGAVHWPARGRPSTALVFDEELPLVDSSIDRMLMVHSLEHAENPRETLKEIWRVLSPGGRLVIVVPNRRGVWARFEHTPFGTGRPFSRGQLNELLRETNFTAGVMVGCAVFPAVAAPLDDALRTSSSNVPAAASGRSSPASSSSRRRSGSIRAFRWRSARRAASSCRCCRRQARRAAFRRCAGRRKTWARQGRLRRHDPARGLQMPSFSS